jgi:integrase
MRTPSYRLHKGSGQAVVTLSGKDYYLGKFGSLESKAEYDRLITRWIAGGRRLEATSDITIAELCRDYLEFADTYYRKNGEPTREADCIEQSLRELRRLYGEALASEFGPLKLKAVRDAIIGTGAARTTINARCQRIARMFKWAVENELVPPSVHHGLKAVAGLRKGRSAARETEPVRPVPDAIVDATLPFFNPQVRAMVELMRLTGMRPGEVVIMRSADLDMAGRVWVYRPSSHKTEHRDKRREVYLGPAAQAVVRPWLKTDLSAFLFSPKDRMEELWEERRQKRRTPRTPSQRARKRNRISERELGDHYTPDSLRIAVRVACAKAFSHPTIGQIDPAERTPEQQAESRRWDREHAWHPNQLRHSAATRIRREEGVDMARIILGHSALETTAIYAEADRERAIGIMARIG